MLPTDINKNIDIELASRSFAKVEYQVKVKQPILSRNYFYSSFCKKALERNVYSFKDKSSSFDPKTKKFSLLYLPKPYLIAGSFHTETYPHDTSYSIWGILNLIEVNKLNKSKYLQLTKDQLDNFYYQVKKYGYPLNGNRTYYKTRSQTNIIPSNVLHYYKVSKDKKWLKKKGAKLAESIFNYWTGEKAAVKLNNESTGYKYFVHGKGPCFEVIDSHKEHNFYYDNVEKELSKIASLPDDKRKDYEKGFDYSKVIKNNKLTDYYYYNDRVNRTTGYDTNHLYGPFNSFASEFLSVDHHAILYKSAIDLSEIYKILGKEEKSKKYLEKASEIKELMFRTFYDKDTGMFFDYHYPSKTLRTTYPFASSFYTIWANLFNIEDPKEKQMLIRLVRYMKKNLEGPDGIYASNIETGLHWDKPYIWPIQQGLIVGGLSSYAMIPDKPLSSYLTSTANTIARKYSSANYNDFLRSKGKKIGEKFLKGNENLFTGYASGSNYTWNLVTVMYFNSLLSIQNP